jgi:hypothetical protein
MSRPRSFEVRRIDRARLALISLVGVVGLAAPAFAGVSVAPGQTVVLGGSDPGGGPADGSSLTCTIGTVDSGCGFPTNFGASHADAGDNEVVADHNPGILNTGLGSPHVASAGIFDDFTIPGSPDDLVSVQFSASYDLSVRLLGSAAYQIGGELSLFVEDITTGTADGVGSTDLFKEERAGDQGFTDLTTGQEKFNIFHGIGHLQLMLRRGHTYRVWFQVETLSEQFVIGRTNVHADATRRRLTVRVDEDETEQLDRIESKLDGINQKLDVLSKTQLEQTLAMPKADLTILQTDRLGEVCDAAQHAVDSSDSLGYRLKSTIQSQVDQGKALEASDPKRAVALCSLAYRSATSANKLN